MLKIEIEIKQTDNSNCQVQVQKPIFGRGENKTTPAEKSVATKIQNILSTNLKGE